VDNLDANDNALRKTAMYGYRIILFVSICYTFYIDCLGAGRSGDPIPLGTTFSAPVQTCPEAHPASCTLGTGSFPGLNCGLGVTLTPHPLLVPRSKIE